MNISRTIAIALVGLSIGLSATSANAGFFTDAVKSAIKDRAQARSQPMQGQQAQQAQSKSPYSWMDKINPKYTQCFNNVWGQTLPQHKTTQLREAIQDSCASKFKPL
jgi:hypothetical protein